MSERRVTLYWSSCLSVVRQAGIVIIQEAGGGVTSRSLLASQRLHADPFTLTAEALMGREFLVIRAISTTQGEAGEEARLRLAKEFYETVGDVAEPARRWG